jgi:hypothetical protein
LKKFKFARCFKRGEKQTPAHNITNSQAECSPFNLLFSDISAAEPCKHWEEKLISVHPEDLSDKERMELERHLEICPKCKAARRQDRIMDSFIRQLPFQEHEQYEEALELPPQLKRLWEFEEMQKSSSPRDTKEPPLEDHHTYNLQDTFLVIAEDSAHQIYRKEHAKREMNLRNIIIGAILLMSICSTGLIYLIVLTSNASPAQEVSTLLLATIFVGAILVIKLWIIRRTTIPLEKGKGKSSALRKRKTLQQTLREIVLL